MLRFSILLFAWPFSLPLQAQLYSPEIKVQDANGVYVGASSVGGAFGVQGKGVRFFNPSDECDCNYLDFGRRDSEKLRFTVGDNHAYIDLWQDNDEGGPHHFFIRNHAYLSSPGNKANDIILVAGDGDNGGGILTIKPDGHVGINDYNPSYDLNVNGTIANNGTMIHSDEKLKRDIQDYSAGLALLKKVKVKKYKYKKPKKVFSPDRNKDEIDDSEQNSEVPEAENAFYNREQVGVLAQDLQQVAPELVESYVDGEGEELLAINHSALTYILISALQEQQTSIELLQNEIDLLKKAKGK